MASADDALALDSKTVRELSGLSGARVLLLSNDDRHWFVRKVATNPAGNDRLRRQMTKQITFGKAVGSVVHTPAILGEGEIDGRFYFDMEFVRGTDGVTYLRRADYADVAALADTFCSYVTAAAALPAAHVENVTLFEALYGRVCDVQRKTSLINSQTLSRLFTALEHVRHASNGLRTTLCHGDLTLENIVIDDQRRVWLLDLLDAPFEHYWQDISKLHQDLEGGWYLKTQRPISRYVLEYVSRRVLNAVNAVDPLYVQIHAVMLACTFVRILPYVRSDTDRVFVQQRIDHFARLAHGES